MATKLKIMEIREKERCSYDDVPYESNAFSFTRPAHLAVIGELFGMEVPNITTARVLELGGASGGNIIPLAAAFPQAHFTGIDLSEKQIEEGCKEIEQLGLKNIKLEAKSITDIDKNFGEFDYIICHGVFSWVPKSVRDDILRVCSENLSPNGLAFVSYNTLPGWGIVSALRDMMMYHTRQFTDTNQKVSEAVKILQFTLNNQPKGDSSPWKEAIEAELKILNGRRTSYLFHEHLEENNNPMYFHEVVKLAENHGLQYLGETSLPSMYLGNMGKNVQESLGQITDIVRQEQYMDFVRNRRFRQTIFCHNDVKLNRKVDLGKIFEFSLSAASNLKPDFNPALEDWNNWESLREFNHGQLRTNNPILTLMLVVLSENPEKIMTIESLISQMQLKVQNLDETQIRDNIKMSGLPLVFQGILELHIPQERSGVELSEKPEIWSYARHRLQQQKSAVNLRHEMMGYDLISAKFLTLLDGTRTTQEAIEELKSALKAQGVKLVAKGGQKTLDSDLDTAIEDYAKKILSTLQKSNLLVR